jgi:hypothetical protein
MNNINSIDKFFDPAKLADDTVIALSDIERGTSANSDSINEGVRLCDYLLHLLQEADKSEVEERRSTFTTFENDRKAFVENITDIEVERKVIQGMKRVLSDLIVDPSSHTKQEIDSIKQYFIKTTMPMWRNRTTEFRDRKMKRSLVIRG